MQLPTSISPNPLFITTIEIRFSTNITKEEMLQKMVLTFSDKFPKLDKGNIPDELKKQEEQFRFAADYILSNDEYLISFTTNSISFEHNSEYKYWRNYFPFIKDSLEKIFKLGFINKIERCGVRYGSMLDDITNPNNALAEIPTIQINGMQSIFAGFQSYFKTDNSTLLLQITPNTKILKHDDERRGLYIDIDASFVNDLNPNNDVYKIIDNLHTDLKKLFFGLLKREFIQTLNPTY
ncbi:TIGR04255 family protein [Flavobacterium sp. J49]|uniref:TIGR04255 family protein n=1 Tax=Flavobacterium sp. J49 TaxID=2718534 RepID=UPI00159375BD|nr:TIGR04255 family protein [Flavobacterium sp. J49]MBF6641801.1 TIGR04255 family protein [Flavobacterium sp. J49]NIC03048.1 TIGR04255 family protein [Flavobacterium sp. J49]